MNNKKYLNIYCDGGVYSHLNKCLWGFIITDNNDHVLSQSGILNGSGGFDVERAESEAIFQALKYCWEYKNNYKLYTDSKSVLDKIENKVPNATKNPNINGIQELIKRIQTSLDPCSVTLYYCKRRSNEWMRKVDDLVNKVNL